MLYSNMYHELPIQVRERSAKKKPLFVVLSPDKPDHYWINDTGKIGKDNEAKQLYINDDGKLNASDPEDVKYIRKIEKTYALTTLVASGYVSENLAGIMAQRDIAIEAHRYGLTLPDNATPAQCYEMQRKLDRSRSTLKDTNFNKLIGAFVISHDNNDTNTVDTEATEVES